MHTGTVVLDPVQNCEKILKRMGQNLNLPVEQEKPEINLPKAISASLERLQGDFHFESCTIIAIHHVEYRYCIVYYNGKSIN